MHPRRKFVLACFLLISACSGPPGAGSEPGLMAVWIGLNDAMSAMSAAQQTTCESEFGTLFPDFGVRGLACVAAELIRPQALIARAGGEAFESGPHTATRESFRMDLTNERDFGHYDEDFVQWVIENGVVGEGRPTLRALTQPIYEGHLQRLARIYWLTYEDMEADLFPGFTPAGILTDYSNFLEGGSIPEGAESYEGGFSVFAFTELSEGILPRIDLRVDNDWTAKYEANTAFGFWLRRRTDGTLAQWLDGLERLLETYDGEWMAARS